MENVRVLLLSQISGVVSEFCEAFRAERLGLPSNQSPQAMASSLTPFLPALVFISILPVDRILLLVWLLVDVCLLKLEGVLVVYGKCLPGSFRLVHSATDLVFMPCSFPSSSLQLS